MKLKILVLLLSITILSSFAGKHGLTKPSKDEKPWFFLYTKLYGKQGNANVLYITQVVKKENYCKDVSSMTYLCWEKLFKQKILDQESVDIGPNAISYYDAADEETCTNKNLEIISNNKGEGTYKFTIVKIVY
jgi:hypothetical protein